MWQKLKLAVFSLRYPTPDEGDFADTMELDEMSGKDGDDNKAANKEKGRVGK